MKNTLLRRAQASQNDKETSTRATASLNNNVHFGNAVPQQKISMSSSYKPKTKEMIVRQLCTYLYWTVMFGCVTWTCISVRSTLFPDHPRLFPPDYTTEISSSKNNKQQSQQYPSFRRVPMVVAMNNNMTGTWNAIELELISIKEPQSETVGLHHLIQSNEDGKHDDDDDDGDESTCQPMHQWQTQTYPQCIRMHEIDMMPRLGSLIFINCGGSRCAWLLVDGNTKVTLKTRKYTSGFYYGAFEDATMDGMVMERLTKSPYVASTYGYCGLSQLVEYSQGGNVHDLVKTTRLRNHHDIQTPLERLKVGIQIANAVADLHTFEHDGITSVTHNDLCCHQFILVDGLYKLNDFHMAKLLKNNRKTNETCKESASFNSHYALVHAPEESNVKYIDTEKSDVFSMGNVMYYVLTKKWLFEDESVRKGLEMLYNGERSHFPHDLRHNKGDPADQALMEGIKLAWIHDPNKRPRAREIADIMIKKLEKIEERKYSGPDSIRVSMPPLPEDYRYSDSDFMHNLT